MFRAAAACACASIMIAGGSFLCLGCSQRIVQSESAIDRDAAAYVRLVLTLGERDSDSLDSYFGPPAWRAEARLEHLTLPDVRRSAVVLQQRIATLSTSRDKDEPLARYDFLTRQLRALVARIDVLTGVHRPFAEESRLLFDVDPPAIDRAAMASIRNRLDRIVPGRGDLTRRLEVFQRRFVVSPDRLPQILSRAVDECRTVTLRHVPVPPDEGIDVIYVNELPWSAFTRYEGGHRSRITVNASVAFTVDDIVQLACHEAYPGHHVINMLVDDGLVRAEHRVELTAQLLFSPQTLLAEGAASIAAHVAFSVDERLRFERATLFPLAGIDATDAELSVRVSRLLDELGPVRTDIAERYMDNQLEFARAAAALERDGLMPSPDATLTFLNRYRTYAVTYVRGAELASAYVAAHASESDAAGRWRAYLHLVTNPSQAFEK